MSHQNSDDSYHLDSYSEKIRTVIWRALGGILIFGTILAILGIFV